MKRLIRGRPSRWFCSVLAFWLLSQPISAEVVRVASYNAHNYLEIGRRVDGFWREDYPKPEEELAALREVIRAAQADILALQEVGSEGHLAVLRADLAREGLEYPYTAIGRHPHDPRQLALLSRVAPQAVRYHPEIGYALDGRRDTVRRGLLEVTFGTGETAWTLYNVHLKSRITDHPDDPLSARQREREARALRDFIRRQAPTDGLHRYLVVGDFNDDLPSPTLRRFLTVSGRTLSYAVPCEDSIGETWTYTYGHFDRYERVDFLLASADLWPRVLRRQGGIIDLLPASRLASDHRLIYLDLRVE